jgi:hypothetical protein
MVSDLDFGCVQVLHIASVSQVLAVEKGGGGGSRDYSPRESGDLKG